MLEAMSTLTDTRYTLRDVQDDVKKDGYTEQYSRIDDTKYTFLTTSVLGAQPTPGLLLSTRDVAGIDHELWAFLREDQVVFVNNTSPHGSTHELRQWNKASVAKLSDLTEGAFTSFNLPYDLPKEVVAEALSQVKALVQCILLKHNLITHLTSTNTLIHLQKACRRAARPTFRLKDFASHGRTHCPEAYAYISNPASYTVQDKTVTFQNGEVKQILCVRMGEEQWERNGNEVWVASVNSTLFIFVKKATCPEAGLVERPGDQRVGPLRLSNLAASIRRTNVPPPIRRKGERRLAVFLEYVYLLTGRWDEVRGEDVLPQFEKACRYALEGETVGTGGGVKVTLVRMEDCPTANGVQKKKAQTEDDNFPRGKVWRRVSVGDRPRDLADMM